MDYYAVLDVPRNATQKEISKAYKRLTKVFDPEINEDMFRLVNEAYQVLSDPAKRAEYDARYDAIAQAQEELTEPEEALVLLCKAIMEHLFGLLDLYELAEFANDCATTLNEARGSPVRPEVRRLALEVAEIAEKDGLMALALLVKLYLSEAKPREPEVAEGVGKRKRVDVYIDLLRLLMPAPSANPPERFGSESADSAVAPGQPEGARGLRKVRGSYVPVSLPKKVRILGGLGTLLMLPLLALVMSMPYVSAFSEGEVSVSAVMSLLPAAVPFWLAGLVMVIMALNRLSNTLVEAIRVDNKFRSMADVMVSLFEPLVALPAVIVMISLKTLRIDSVVLFSIFVSWLIPLYVVFLFKDKYKDLMDEIEIYTSGIKTRLFKIAMNLRVYGTLLSFALVGTLALPIAYVLQAVGFFSLPGSFHVRRWRVAYESTPMM